MYRYYITEAKRNGYQICSMEQFWREKETDRKHFILRHDFDHKSTGTRRMYELEKACGVVSTYYFRHCTMDAGLMREMQEYGFEVGLHYETLSDYAEEKFLDTVDEHDLLIRRERLKKEIAEFQRLLPKKISSVCSHGAAANRRIRCSNNVLLEGECCDDYSIEFEAYDKIMYEKYVDEHIMDNTICENYGFSYAADPISAIQSGKRNIIFLTHPNHWQQSFGRSVKDLMKLMLGRCTYSSNRSFVRIQDSHTGS